MRIKFSSLLVVAVVSFPGIAAPDTHPSPSLVTDDYASVIEVTAPALLKKYKVPAAGVGIIKNGEVVFNKVYGELEQGKPAPDNTIFNVASITKSVVAVTVMKLVEKGQWNLDEPLYHYFTDPDIADDPRAKLITTRHCLSHTVGFKNWRRLEDNGRLQFNFEPGTRYQYSGEGMEYVRKAIEAKFKQPFADIVDSVVFTPLAMNDTTLNWLNERQLSRFAMWHDTFGNLHDVDHSTPNTNAADDLLITVEDMLKFDLAVLKNSVLSQQTFNLMVTPQVTVNRNIEQSLGWVSLDDKSSGVYLINHDGGDTGVIATNIVFPNSQDAIVVFTNSNNGASVTNRIIADVLQGGTEIVQKLRWENPMPEEVDVTTEYLKLFTGVYETNRGFNIEFVIDDDKLMTVSAVYPRQSLLAIGGDEFVPQPFEVYFRFEQSGGEKVMQLLGPDRKVELTGTLTD